MRPDIRQAWSDPAYREQVREWATDHGLNPNDLALDVDIDADGTVHLTRYLRNGEGRLVWNASKDAPASEPVIVTPARPFPVPKPRVASCDERQGCS